MGRFSRGLQHRKTGNFSPNTGNFFLKYRNTVHFFSKYRNTGQKKRRYRVTENHETPSFFDAKLQCSLSDSEAKNVKYYFRGVNYFQKSVRDRKIFGISKSVRDFFEWFTPRLLWYNQLPLYWVHFWFWLASITFEQLMNAFSLLNRITSFGCGKSVVVKNYLTSRKNENN